jgi:hypothetical protein
MPRSGRRAKTQAKVAQDPWEGGLHEETEYDTHRRSHQPKRSRLNEVRAEYSALGGSQASEHCHRLELFLDKDVHSTGHTDPAQQQRRQPDQPKEARHVPEHPRQILHLFRYGVVAHPVISKELVVVVQEVLKRRVVFDLEVRLIPGNAPEPKKPGFLQIGARNEDARTDRALETYLAR